MAEIATFWNEQHPLNEQSRKLCDQLVPDMGKCDTVVGELLRASQKINWDWFNNGWGCNNWSGAVCFIEEYYDELPLDAGQVALLKRELAYVKEYSHGEPSSHLDYNRRPCEAVTNIHAILVAGILATSPVDWSNNEVDMYDLSEEDYIAEEEDEEDYDDLYNTDLEGEDE